MTVEASAPGKAVLCGEYAVLDGAPAIVMAVDRRARVRIERTGDDVHRVRAPGLHDAAVAFRAAANGSIDWRDGAAAARRFGLLEQVWRVVAPAPERGLALALDTRAFFREPGGRKLGFGSSAALAAALAAALSGEASGAGDLYRTAAVAHRNFQEGKGSGVDVATAVHGGVIAYRMEQAEVEALDWPAGLHFAVLWSGRPVSTGEKLARLAAGARGTSAGGLADAAAGVLGAWREGGAAAILERLRGYSGALQRFSDEHELGVFDGGHRVLAADAEGRGLVYKPCGAGGGDIGIVLAEEAAAVAAFAEDARVRGFEPLPVACDPCGVQREGELAA